MGAGAVLPSKNSRRHMGGGVDEVVTYGWERRSVDDQKEIYGGLEGMTRMIAARDDAEGVTRVAEATKTPTEALPTEAVAKTVDELHALVDSVGVAKAVDALEASRESNVVLTPAAKARHAERLKGKGYAVAGNVEAVKRNVGAKVSVAVKYHGYE